jgi:hypothetical protein
LILAFVRFRVGVAGNGDVAPPRLALLRLGGRYAVGKDTTVMRLQRVEGYGILMRNSPMVVED